MSLFKKFFLFIFIFTITFILYGCSASKNLADDDYFAPGGDYEIPGLDAAPSDKEDAKPSEPDAEGDEVNNQGPIAGQITAAAWSDTENYDFWLSLFESTQENSAGLFSEYFIRLNEYSSSIYTQNMITVNITNDNNPLEDLSVKVYNDNYSFETKTNTFGNAYLFLPQNPTFPYTIEYNDQTYELSSYSKEAIKLTVDKNNSNTKLLDLMFVIDTTGSMGDELEYLKSEIKDVIENINTDQNNIRLSLLFYRDTGDQYVTRFYNFTNNISEQINNISNQNANGGGDFPEAVDQALSMAVTQGSWSNEPSTKLLIHVLDAPPHTSKENLSLFTKSILQAAQKGIHIIPVASSGIDKWTEYLLRVEALITGGTYTYLTNDSGIGNDHIDATVESVVVEYLNAMLIRLINEYYTGIKTEPIPYNQTNKNTTK